MLGRAKTGCGWQMFQQRLNERPMARRERLVVQRMDDELVVYDSLTHEAHCLAPAAVTVWELANGQRTCAEIADACGWDLEAVHAAVHVLREKALVDAQPEKVGLSRRDAAKRLARVGGAALAAPLIYSVAIPSSAAAASCLSQGSTVTCGSGQGRCQASAGAFSTVKGTSCECYQGESNNTCYYTTSDISCKAFGATCTQNSDCCAGSCSGSPTKTCQQ